MTFKANDPPNRIREQALRLAGWRKVSVFRGGKSFPIWYNPTYPLTYNGPEHALTHREYTLAQAWAKATKEVPP